MTHGYERKFNHHFFFKDFYGFKLINALVVLFHMALLFIVNKITLNIYFLYNFEVGNKNYQ